MFVKTMRKIGTFPFSCLVSYADLLGLPQSLQELMERDLEENMDLEHLEGN